MFITHFGLFAPTLSIFEGSPTGGALAKKFGEKLFSFRSFFNVSRLVLQHIKK